MRVSFQIVVVFISKRWQNLQNLSQTYIQTLIMIVLNILQATQSADVL